MPFLFNELDVNLMKFFIFFLTAHEAYLFKESQKPDSPCTCACHDRHDVHPRYSMDCHTDKPG